MEAAYEVISGLIFLLFAGISIFFEFCRATRLRVEQGDAQELDRRFDDREVATDHKQMLSPPVLSEDNTSFGEKESEIRR